MATKINGIEIPAAFGATLGGSPEDSAKAFMVWPLRAWQMS